MPLVVIPFLAFAAAFVLAGLSQTFNAQHGQESSGGFLGYLSDVLSTTLQTLTAPAQKAARYVVSRFAAAQFRALTAYLYSVAGLWRATFHAQSAQAKATADVAHALERAIPAEAQKAAAPALRLGHLNARHLSRFEAQVKPAVKHLSVAVDVTIPQQLGRIRARERAVERDQAKLRERTGLIENGATRVWDWLRDHPYSAAMGAFAAVTSIALGRIGLDWLKCRNVGNAGRRLCGLGSDLLDALLLGTLAVEGSVSLVSLGHELVGLSDEIVPAVTGFVRELSAVEARTAAEQGFA